MQRYFIPYTRSFIDNIIQVIHVRWSRISTHWIISFRQWPIGESTQQRYLSTIAVVIEVVKQFASESSEYVVKDVDMDVLEGARRC